MCPVRIVTYVSGRSKLSSSPYPSPIQAALTSRFVAESHPDPVALRRYYA